MSASALFRSVAAGLLLTGATGSVAAADGASAVGWSHGSVVGRGASNTLGDEYGLPRIALSADGRGTIVWGRWGALDGGVGLVGTSVRDLRADGSLGPATALRLLGHTAVARDGAGHPIVAGVDDTGKGASRPWLATRSSSGSWSQRVVDGNPAWVFGQASGFSLLSGKGDPSITGLYVLRSFASPAATRLTEPRRLAPELTPDDGADDHTWDGSNVAQLADGTVVTAGWRFATAKSAAYAQPDSGGLPVLLTFSPTPTAVPITGDTDFGATAIDTAGDHVALAGLHE
ncbi:MAG: hypothetical protein REI11_21670, partial [Patulibacter sp.]|nr:hypothetical protein [Patulibacter sp.]